MRRAVAAACATCLTSAAFFPIDTIKLSRQLNHTKMPVNLYAGLRHELTGTTIGTFSYFEVYEFTRNCIAEPLCIPISSFIAVVLSGFIAVPFSILKKVQQNLHNSFVSNIRHEKVTCITFWKTYLLSVSKQIPNSILKYTLYENLLQLSSHQLPIYYCGAICGGISSIICSLILTPIEVLKTKCALGLKFNMMSDLRKHGFVYLYAGAYPGIFLSFCQNTLGHFFLELWGPR